jgi:hypothetical protein
MAGVPRAAADIRLESRVGTIELKIPRVSAGANPRCSSLAGGRIRRCTRSWSEAYLKGISTRKIEFS